MIPAYERMLYIYFKNFERVLMTWENIYNLLFKHTRL